MIATPMDVLKNHPVRRTAKQKQAFRVSVQSYLQGHGYSVRTEGRGSVKNLIAGDPETARFLITAHYDTPAAAWEPHLLMPCNRVWNAMCQLFNAIVGLVPAVAAGLLAYLAGRSFIAAVLAMAVLVILRPVWMLFGPASRHNANGNTSGVVALLETAASMPRNLRSRVCFVLLDRGEPDMAGSAAHRKAHFLASRYQTVIDLNSVGDGDVLIFFPGEELKHEGNLLCLERRCGPRTVAVWKKRSAWVSDHLNFPRSVGVAALHKGKFGYWLGRTHTCRDTVLDYTNVNILRACLITYISSPAAE